MSSKKPAAKKPKAVEAAPAPKAEKAASPASSTTVNAPKSPVGQALQAGIAAFSGQKKALADYLGMEAVNLSRALRESREFDEGKRTAMAVPSKCILPLARVAGVTPHTLAPHAYEPQWKVKRAKPKLVDGGWITE